MPITYPLNTPTNIGIANITLMAENAVAVSQSPFTFAQQIVAHPGQRWAASISLPPMKRQDAENWIAFLLSLKGQVGTFLLGDPNAVNHQGTALKNKLLYTQQFDNAYWAKTRTTVTADTTAAPDTTTTADSLIETAVASTHVIARSLNYTAGVTYTLSVYVKPIGARNVRVDLPSAVFGGTTAAFFDITAGTVISTTGSPVATITDAGNGWFRCTVTKTATVSTGASLNIYIVTGTTTTSYTGDGVSGLYLWGAQVEEGSVATTYQQNGAGNSPLVNGAGQTGGTLNIDNCSISEVGYLLAGDYLQIGSGSGAQLYKVLTQVNTSATGTAAVDIWPNLRSSPADNAAITLINTKGRFRLKDNISQWSINEISSYGITFDCVEAL